MDPIASSLPTSVSEYVELGKRFVTLEPTKMTMNKAQTESSNSVRTRRLAIVEDVRTGFVPFPGTFLWLSHILNIIRERPEARSAGTSGIYTNP